MQIALPLAIPWVAAIIMALLDGRRRNVGWLAVGVLIATFVAVAALGLDVYRNGDQVQVA